MSNPGMDPDALNKAKMAQALMGATPQQGGGSDLMSGIMGLLQKRREFTPLGQVGKLFGMGGG